MNENDGTLPRARLLSHSRGHSIYICQEFDPSAASLGAPSRFSVSKNNQTPRRRPTCEHHCSKINNRKVAATEFFTQSFYSGQRNDLLEKEQNNVDSFAASAEKASEKNNICVGQIFLVRHFFLR
jgi:hypothetical protein